MAFAAVLVQIKRRTFKFSDLLALDEAEEDSGLGLGATKFHNFPFLLLLFYV